MLPSKNPPCNPGNRRRLADSGDAVDICAAKAEPIRGWGSLWLDNSSRFLRFSVVPLVQSVVRRLAMLSRARPG